MGSDYKEQTRSKIESYYSRREVQKAIYKSAQDKEIGIFCFFENTKKYGFLKRPDVITSPADVYELVKKGATSFHFSEESWIDPLQLSSNSSRKDLDNIRKGWDLIIDIDTPLFETSKIAAKLIIDALRYHGVISVTCKFSGNNGFHIGVPFEAFPNQVYDKEVRNLFPEGPRLIAKYIKNMIREFLSEKLLSYKSQEELSVELGVDSSVLEEEGVFDPFKVVDIDTILISSRHLCRMPYVFNEKSGLISIPIDPDKIMHFSKEEALPENVVVNKVFLDRGNVGHNEAKQLFISAYDEETISTKSIYNLENESVEVKKTYDEFVEVIPMDCFPFCIKKILAGLDDGKKRALFILINFLRSSGYNKGMIEDIVKEWNLKNKEPLKEVYIKSQLRYAQQNEKRLPPNCESEAYYKGLNLCKPDSLCGNVKNPLAYAKIRYLGRKNN